MRYSMFALLITGVILVGCISETSVFHSPDGKQTVVCSGAGFGIIRGTMAINEYHNCREAYLKAGYIEGPAPASTQSPPVPAPVPSLKPRQAGTVVTIQTDPLAARGLALRFCWFAAKYRSSVHLVRLPGDGRR